MYCKHCNVNVNTAYDECPLCHAPLEGEPSEVAPYPERQKRKNKRPITFAGIYNSIAWPIILVCIVLNAVLPHDYLWALMVAIGALYVFFTFKTTIFYKGVGGAKVFSQTIMLTLLVISVQYIFKTSEWAFSFAIPVISMSSVAMHLVLVGIFHKKKGNQYLRYMWLTSLVGVLSAIMVAAGVVTFPYLAYSAFAVSAVSVIALLVFTGRTIEDEIKKKSHI